MTYTYENLKVALSSFCHKYPFAKCGTIGKSVMGKELYSIQLGTGPGKLICVGAHHSLEWLTSVLLMSFADAYAHAYQTETPLEGIDTTSLFSRCSITLIPMLNPDGIELVAGRLLPDNPYYQEALQLNGGRTDFGSVWQSNIRGVDLNHNYDAAWYEGKQLEEVERIGPGPTRFAGPYPESEPESHAMADFTRELLPDVVIAYHSQGEEIYYDFRGHIPPGGAKLAEEMAALSGYRLSQPEGFAGFGGYKDWFIDAIDRPGYTIEIGLGKNPIGFDQLNGAVTANFPVILAAAEYASRQHQLQ